MSTVTIKHLNDTGLIKDMFLKEIKSRKINWIEKLKLLFVKKQVSRDVGEKKTTICHYKCMDGITYIIKTEGINNESYQHPATMGLFNNKRS